MQHLTKNKGGVKLLLTRNFLRGSRKLSLLRTASGQFNKAVKSVIHWCRDAKFRAPARNITIQRVNLRALLAMQVLSGRGKRLRHLRGDFKGTSKRHLGVLQPGRTNSGGPRDG